jgi:phosphonate transport system permease protein
VSSIVRPVRAQPPIFAISTSICVIVLLVAAAQFIDFHPLALFSRTTIDSMRDVWNDLWPGDWSRGTVRNAWRGTYETLSMSFVGTMLGALFGAALMPFCSTQLFVYGPLVDEEGRSSTHAVVARCGHWLARIAANTLRTVPYFVWALLFVYMVGLGTFPGTLAIAVHTTGVFARLFSTALDNLDMRPLIALRAAGARRMHVLLFGMLPALRPTLVSYTLYRWEVNIRESAVLGLVGAGGIGYYLKYALGTFDKRGLFTYLLAAMALVLSVDWLSARLRKTLI